MNDEGVYEIDLQDEGAGVDVENVQASDRPKPGWYHCLVQDFDDKAAHPEENMIATFEILDGTVPSEIGKSSFYPIPKLTSLKEKKEGEGIAKTQKEYAVKAQLNYAYATGLTTPAEVKSLKEQGKNPKLRFRESAGRQVIVHFKEDEYQGKKTSSIAMLGVYHLNDPAGAKCPRNEGMLQQAGDDAASEEFASAF